ncbi:hypothetical protein KZX45_08385 [Georgenia sp. EYE_87]|uniref:hypothetical protein n=1 Tax=Georgenia sp. EYE_87 TaxID=2853448 RepID=UPI002002C2D6|nr:hypothetical protein [Georgenia sp. EYE_87]MCK6210559.1 hypothetical protein [Georgenia sp. EYE_87]
MTPRRTVGIVAAVAAILTAAGCAATPAEPQPAAAPAAPSSAPATSSSRPTDEPMEELTGHEQDPIGPPPTWDETAAEEAADRAVAFMRAFARPDLTAQEWHAGIAGLMTTTGVETFAYVDPAAVPATTVTDGGEVLDTGSASLAEVRVGTDAGPYLVTLTRTGATDPWLVEYADPIN